MTTSVLALYAPAVVRARSSVLMVVVCRALRAYARGSWGAERGEHFRRAYRRGRVYAVCTRRRAGTLSGWRTRRGEGGGFV